VPELVKKRQYYVFRVGAFESRSHERELLCEKDPDRKIAWITFNRPEKHNALTIAGWARLVNLLADLEVDDEIKAIVFKGTGSHLGTGMDAGELGAYVGFGAGKTEAEKRRPSQRMRIVRDKQTWFGERGVEQAILNLLKPTIVEAQGYCYGGHLWLCAYADIVIASEDAMFSHPAWRYLGPVSNFPLMYEVLGLKKVKEMVLTSRPLDAYEAERFGLVTKVVPHDRLEEEILEYAAAVTAHSLDGIMMGKALMYASLEARGIGLGYAMCGWMGHPWLTNLQYMPDEWNFLKQRRDQGLSRALDDVDAEYDSRFSLRQVRKQTTD
jgi:enoyl-CoA hydratase